MQKGTIGVFDSGLGGLLMLRAIRKRLPQYDYLYLGDTKRVPYGDRSHAVIYQFLEEAVDFLFGKGCELIIVACNTASASALRKIQQEYLPAHYPDRRVLGVIIPTAEVAMTAKRVGVLATEATVTSETFVKELGKLNPTIEVFQQAAPLLVPLIENNALDESVPFLNQYLAPLIEKQIDTLILGCTHYALLADRIRPILGNNIKLIAEEDIVPEKLTTYLDRHPEITRKIGTHGTCALLVTDLNDHYKKTAATWFGAETKLDQVTIAND